MITHDALEKHSDQGIFIEVNGVKLCFTTLYDSLGKHPMWESEDKKLRCLCGTEVDGYSGYFCGDTMEIIPDIPGTGLDYIRVYVGDYNGDYWFMYMDIDGDNIDEAWEAIREANWRDGDIRIELIDYFGDTGGLYEWCDNVDDNYALNPKVWDIWYDKGDEHFEYCVEADILDPGYIESAEFYKYEDKWDYMAAVLPDIYQELRKANLLDYFEIDDYISDCNANSTIIHIGDAIIEVA